MFNSSKLSITAVQLYPPLRHSTTERIGKIRLSGLPSTHSDSDSGEDEIVDQCSERDEGSSAEATFRSI